VVDRTTGSNRAWRVAHDVGGMEKGKGSLGRDKKDRQEILRNLISLAVYHVSTSRRVRNGVMTLRYSGVLFAPDTRCVKTPNP